MSESVPSRPRITIDRDFYLHFHEEDQRLMQNGGWDYLDPELQINKLKRELEAIDDEQLTEDQLHDKNRALWLWYHHSSQFAYGKRNDAATALDFIDKALIYREKIGLDNQITPLLKLLYLGALKEAREFALSIPERVLETNGSGVSEEIENPERGTAIALIDYFEKKRVER